MRYEVKPDEGPRAMLSKKWLLVDDGILYDRFPTKEAAQQEKKLRERNDKVREWLDGCLDAVCRQAVEKFHITPREAEALLSDASEERLTA